MNNQEQLFKVAELPNKQIVATLNNQHDKLEALFNRLMQLEAEVVELRGKK